MHASAILENSIFDFYMPIHKLKDLKYQLNLNFLTSRILSWACQETCFVHTNNSKIRLINVLYNKHFYYFSEIANDTTHQLLSDEDGDDDDMVEDDYFPFPPDI